MRRIAVLLLSLLVTLAVGCARQAPVPTSAPSGSASAAPLRIGATSDQSVQVLAELYAQALVAKGRPASVVEVGEDVNTQVSRLMANELDVVPAFAWSAAQQLEVDTSDPQSLIPDLAATLDGEVAVLQPSKIDRAWHYASTRSGASLLDLAKKTTIVAPERWKTSPDGPSGLEAIYQAKPAVTIIADPAQRLARVKAGAIGVFDGTEPQLADPAVKPVEDPKTMIAAAPQVVLLRLDVAGDATVLDVVQQLHGMIDNTAIIGIRRRSVASGVPAAVGEWLKAHPLR